VRAALLEWRNGNGAGAEIFSRAHREFGLNLPPHPTSAAALITMIRDALIFDDGDTLLLTLAPGDPWWSGSRVSRAPTRWGVLDLSFQRAQDRAHWSWTPVPVWTRLRVPPGTRLAAAPAPPLAAQGAHFVLAPPGTGSAEVALEREERTP
jgi:hypothetical protein